MTKQPCLKVLIIFIIGIILGRYFYIPFSSLFSFLVIFFLLSLLFFIKQKELMCNIFLGLSILASGFILTLNSIHSPENISLKKFIGADVEIAGKIAGEPKIYSRWADYNLLLKNINDEEIKGFIRLRVYGGRIFSYNDIIKFKAVLEEPPFNLLSEGVSAVSRVSASKVEKTGEDEKNIIRGASIVFKRYMQNQYSYYLPKMESSLLSGIILGGDQSIPEGIKKIFRDTGTVHILAVSGMNVGLVGIICFVIFGDLLRFPRKIAVIPGILMVWFYSLVTGMNPPVVRSAVTLTIIFLGYILEREGNVLNSLSLAALIILLLSPLTLFSISFQLSFVCVLSMILIYPELEKIQIKEINKEEKKKKEDLERINKEYFSRDYMGKIYNNIKALFLLSLAIQIGIWPIGAFYFQQVSLISVIANIFVVPLVAVILYSGVTMVIFSGIPFLAKILAGAGWIILIILEKIVLFFAKLPYSNILTQNYSLFSILCYYIIIILCLNRGRFYGGQKG